MESHISQAPVPPHHSQPPPDQYTSPFSEVTIERDRDILEMRPLVQALIQVQRRMMKEREEQEQDEQDRIHRRLATEKAEMDQQLDQEVTRTNSRRNDDPPRHRPPLRIPTHIASPVARHSSWIDQIESASSTPPTLRQKY